MIKPLGIPAGLEDLVSTSLACSVSLQGSLTSGLIKDVEFRRWGTQGPRPPQKFYTRCSKQKLSWKHISSPTMKLKLKANSSEAGNQETLSSQGSIWEFLHLSHHPHLHHLHLESSLQTRNLSGSKVQKKKKNPITSQGAHCHVGT